MKTDLLEADVGSGESNENKTAEVVLEDKVKEIEQKTNGAENKEEVAPTPAEPEVSVAKPDESKVEAPPPAFEEKATNASVGGTSADRNPGSSSAQISSNSQSENDVQKYGGPLMGFATSVISGAKEKHYMAGISKNVGKRAYFAAKKMAKESAKVSKNFGRIALGVGALMAVEQIKSDLRNNSGTKAKIAVAISAGEFAVPALAGAVTGFFSINPFVGAAIGTASGLITKKIATHLRDRNKIAY